MRRVSVLCGPSQAIWKSRSSRTGAPEGMVQSSAAAFWLSSRVVWQALSAVSALLTLVLVSLPAMCTTLLT